jgi:hypothetical protein
MQQAQDTFTAQLKDGSFMSVVKGAYLPDSHELVKRDQDGSGSLFKRADLGEDDKPGKSGPGKADAPKAAPGKPAAGKAS